MKRVPAELWVALATLVGYGLTAPAVVNGDGLGYARAAFFGARYAGHVGYVPLLAALGRALGATRPVDFVCAGRALSGVGAAACVWLVGRIARRYGAGAFGAALAATGMAASYGLFCDGADVEVYAPALAALLAALLCALQQEDDSFLWVLASALFFDGAVLLHIEAVLFALPLLVVTRRRWLGAAVTAIPLAVAYGWAAPATQRWAWLLSASHGLPNPHVGVMAPAAALYGMAKTLVYSPYPFEAPLAKMLATSALGLAALVGGVGLARGAKVDRALTWLWLLPFATVGLLFYASDSERWIFVLPLFWLRLACAVDADAARRPAAAALTAGLLVLNALLCIPTARDRAWIAQAQRVPARAGDLVVGPGHGWDEYVGFYDDSGATTWPLVFYVARDGVRAADELRAYACWVRRAGHHVFVVRFSDDHDARGYKELARLGWPRERAGALLPTGTRRKIAPGIEELIPTCEEP